MTRLATAAVIGLLSSVPLQAGESKADPDLSLIEQGARLLMQGLAEELAPAIEDLSALSDTVQPALRNFIVEMGPALADILSKIDDISAYHAPEILPNGDIIMRRKTPKEPDNSSDTEIDT